MYPAGENPPIHHRYNETEALAAIRRRYEAVLRFIPAQIEKLQADPEFRAHCQSYYARGYKDWVILMAIMNCMMNWRLNYRGIDVRDVAKFSPEKIGEELNDDTHPTWRFLGEDMERQIDGHGVLVLPTYGFEMRRSDFKPAVIEKFLRERMNHFALDLPHKPLFGEPPGDWPDLALGE